MLRLLSKSFVLAAALAFVWSATAAADQGMWTFDRFPTARVLHEYGFAPSPQWLDHVRLSTARIAQGCSSSFVSAQGLVMTNHHCVITCVGQVSKPGQDYVAAGFYAKRPQDEVQCPGLEIDRLEAMTDVTPRVRAALGTLAGDARNAALRAVTAQLQQQTCGLDRAKRCDLVPLYHGGIYQLYRYHRYDDVRLVFAPEYAIGQFGGDPDNFNFPRWGFDLGLLRVYENGAPAATPDHLTLSRTGSKSGELVFVVGNPGSTQRLYTISELQYLRDVQYPETLRNDAELRGVLEQFGERGAEERRESNEVLFGIENRLKGNVGRDAALLDEAFFAKKADEERALRAEVAKRPELERAYGSAWDAMARAQARKRDLQLRYEYVSGPRGSLYSYAQLLVRAAAERAKPNADRLPEFNDAALVSLPRRVDSRAPVYASVEELQVEFSLAHMRAALGPDDPFVKSVLRGLSPAERAHDLVSGSKLADPAVRRKLYDGGAAAIAGSDDSMIRFAREIDAPTRAIRKTYEAQVTAPENAAAEAIARARFAVLGTSVYPDATFSPRVSYGKVDGFTTEDARVAPYTTVAGLYARAGNAPPFALPPTWTAAKGAVDPSLPMDLSTTNDIIGGNSGSPLVDEHAQVVGLIFDGNIYSLSGAFGYDASRNRAVAVDSRVILAALSTIYHADRIVREIGAP